MCPSWNSVADEVEALASDRLVAAQVEPDDTERTLLARESQLLHMAADAALEQDTDEWLEHSACEGVVVHCEELVVWGITPEAEEALRDIATDAPPDVTEDVDGIDVLRVVVGVPPDEVATGADGGDPPDAGRGPRRPLRPVIASIAAALMGAAGTISADVAPAVLLVL